MTSTAGYVEFVKEILRLKPSFAEEVNQDGFSPLHLASAIGHFEIVKELLKLNPKLCCLEGRNRWTALHYVASRGRADIIREMLLACPESIEDVNVQKETTLHLAVKNSQFKAIHFMVKWVKEMKKDEIFNMKMNLAILFFILHHVENTARQVVEWILDGYTGGANAIVELVNVVNQIGLTALDVPLIFQSEAGDRKIKEILKTAGGRKVRDMSLSSIPSFENNSTTTTDLCANNLVEYFKFKRGRDCPSDARTALLVIAVLVTTATLQAGLNPPGGVWQDTKLDGSHGNPSHDAGRSILGSYALVTYLLFMLFNTIGFSVSIYMIAILISNFPFQWEFQVSTIVNNDLSSAENPILSPADIHATEVDNRSILEIVEEQPADFVSTTKVSDVENPALPTSAAETGNINLLHHLLAQSSSILHTIALASNENPLHIASTAGHVEFVKEMIRLKPGMKKDEILNMKDELGNSILHLATWRKHRQATGDREIEDILRHAGGRRANDIAHPAVSVTTTDNRTPVNDGWRISNFFSVLVATATFQAGLNPPGGVWQDTDLTGAPKKPAHLAGRSIMGSYSSIAYLMIMVPNCIGYNTGITFMAPESLNSFLAVFSSALPCAMPLLIRLFVAAQTGNIQILHQLLAENPFILHTIELSSQGFNPLDIASTAGHVEFVKEIIRLRPDFAKQVNQDGFSPIHIAAALGNLEIVREFMKVDQKLCRLEGRNRWTALHYAASRGKVDTIQEMLLACPESIEDVTVQNETALHLAVKNCQFQAINFIVTWVVEWLISNPGTNPLPLEVNAVNKSGLTALDVLLIFTSEAGDREIEEILRNAGARRARDMIMSLSTTPPYEITNNNIQTPSAANGPTTSDLCADNLVNYFKFKRGRDSPSDARTALLVIAVLVATATFQAGLNPPGGVWQDTKLDGSTGNPSHDAGRSILGSYASVTYLLFMLFNTIGFSVSIYMIAILISNFPFQWEFQVCIVAINFTYVTAITYMAPTNMSLPLTVFSIVFPFLVPHVFKLFVRLAKLLKRISEISGIQNHLNTVSELFWY
ncbi:hypothetical protein FEM48_Zijuj03G0127700 [Ziziphus jujuba var. spinosa]|uniref:PGG domain-containing protein n=1 Tax=Ziziphus jujuba var. spinosa TaxID=714518 RepID=A0A978VQE1_ZIZJJ|nr:hypothetical protein FEM48_Zijuj03G0127700 [Ziziphus jujuba var. spinosa]